MLTNKFNLFKTFSPDDGGAGGGAPAGETPAGDAQATWEAWLEKQPEEVRKMYETHTSGLKTALNPRGRKQKPQRQPKTFAGTGSDRTEAQRGGTKRIAEGPGKTGRARSGKSTEHVSTKTLSKPQFRCRR